MAYEVFVPGHQSIQVSARGVTVTATGSLGVVALVALMTIATIVFLQTT